MRHRFLLIAVLAGIALALLGPVRPVAADDVDCHDVFVVDPTLCDDDLPPPDAPPTRVTPPEMLPGEPDMRTNVPGAPTPRPGEQCTRIVARDGIFVRERGIPDKLVYTLIVDAGWCYRQGIVTRATVTSRADPVIPVDPRLTALTQTTTSLKDPPGGPTLRDIESVFFTGCGDRFNDASCQNFRHDLGVLLRGDGTAFAQGNLAFINGPIPIST